MKIYLLRHGETNHNIMRVKSDYTIKTTGNDCLSPLGKKQAHAAAEKIKNIQFKKIYVSPMLRTRQTAEIIFANAHFDCPVVFDTRLVEYGHIRNHLLSGKHLAAYNSTNGIDRELFRGLTGGRETEQETYDRIHSFMTEMKRQPNGDYLIIAHGGIISLIQLYLNKTPLDEWNEKWQSIAPENCELRVLEI